MFLADTHSDTLFSLGVGKRTFAQTDITPDRLRQGGVSLQTLALWSGPKGPNGDYEAVADAEYAAIHHFTDAGIRQVVLHGGFIPHVYFPEWYVEQSVLFWRDFLQEVPPDFVLALENVMEPSPDTLVSITAGVDDPRLGLCLDVGHANTCVSRTPPLDWIAPMAPYLRHVHLHNNRGQDDLHAPLDEGTVPMGEIIGAVLEQAPRATFTIENQDALPSLRWLAQQGYIEDIL